MEIWIWQTSDLECVGDDTVQLFATEEAGIAAIKAEIESNGESFDEMEYEQTDGLHEWQDGVTLFTLYPQQVQS